MSDTPNTTPSPTATATASLPPKRRRRRGWLWSWAIVLLVLIVVVVADLSGVITVVKPPQWLHIPLPSVNKAAPHGQQTQMPGSLLWKLGLLPANTSNSNGSPTYDYQIVQNIAYVEADFSHIGVVYAVNLTTGKPLWKDNLTVTGFPDCAWCEPQIVGDVMYARATPTQYYGPGSTTFYAINLSDGSVKWKVSVPWENDTYIAGDSGVYVVSGSHTDALNAKDGTLRWQTAVGSLTLPVIQGGIIYLTGGTSVITPHASPDVYAFNTSDGSLRWSTFISGSYGDDLDGVIPDPVASDGLVYFTSLPDPDSNLFALNTKDGSLRWYFDSGSERTLYFGATIVVENNILYLATDSAMYALNVADGSQRWMNTSVGNIAQFSLANDVIYVTGQDQASGDGIVYAVNASTGALRWKYQIPSIAGNSFNLPSVRNGSSTPVATDTPSPATTSYSLSLPKVANGAIYVAASLSVAYIYALNTTTGALLWKFKAPGQFLGATNGAGYFGGSDGYLYALTL